MIDGSGEDAGGQTDMRRRSVCCTRSIPFPYILENKVDSAEGKREFSSSVQMRGNGVCA